VGCSGSAAHRAADRSDRRSRRGRYGSVSMSRWWAPACSASSWTAPTPPAARQGSRVGAWVCQPSLAGNGAVCSPQVGDNLWKRPYPTEDTGRKPGAEVRVARRWKAPRVRLISKPLRGGSGEAALGLGVLRPAKAGAAGATRARSSRSGETREPARRDRRRRTVLARSGLVRGSSGSHGAPYCTRLSIWCAPIARQEVSERIGLG